MVVNLDDDRQNKISFKNILIISLIFLTALGVVVGTQFLPKKTTYKSKASEISVNQNSIVDWGNAGYFYGGGYVKTNNSYNIGKFSSLTIEAWVYLIEKPGTITYPIIYKEVKPQSGCVFSYLFSIENSKKLKFTYSVPFQNRWAPTEIVSNSIINPKQWTHVAVVYDNSPYNGIGSYLDHQNIKLYINGKLDNYQPEKVEIGGGSTNSTCYSSNVIVGRTASNTFSFSGQLDEVRISNVRRYSGQQVFLSTSPFIFDGNTLLLLHFNQANGNPVVESILPNISATNYGITYVNHIVVPTPEPTRVLDRGNVGGPVSSPTGTQ